MKGILETREQTVNSRCKCCCSSDMGLTVLDADESERINVFKTELWRGVGPLRVNLWLWIREIRCFTQLFSEYHAGGEAAQPPKERDSLSQDF